MGIKPTGNFSLSISLCAFQSVVCGLQFFSHRFDCLHVLDPFKKSLLQPVLPFIHVLACKINEIRFLPSLVLVPMVSQHRVANYSHCPLTTRCCPCALQVLLLPLPPAWCEIHPAWRRKRPWLLDVATQILMHLLRVVY